MATSESPTTGGESRSSLERTLNYIRKPYPMQHLKRVSPEFTQAMTSFFDVSTQMRQVEETLLAAFDLERSKLLDQIDSLQEELSKYHGMSRDSTEVSQTQHDSDCVCPSSANKEDLWQENQRLKAIIAQKEAQDTKFDHHSITKAMFESKHSCDQEIRIIDQAERCDCRESEADEFPVTANGDHSVNPLDAEESLLITYEDNVNEFEKPVEISQESGKHIKRSILNSNNLSDKCSRVLAKSFAGGEMSMHDLSQEILSKTSVQDGNVELNNENAMRISRVINKPLQDYARSASMERVCRNLSKTDWNASISPGSLIQTLNLTVQRGATIPRFPKDLTSFNLDDELSSLKNENLELSTLLRDLKSDFVQIKGALEGELKQKFCLSLELQALKAENAILTSNQNRQFDLPTSLSTTLNTTENARNSTLKQVYSTITPQTTVENNIQITYNNTQIPLLDMSHQSLMTQPDEVVLEKIVGIDGAIAGGYMSSPEVIVSPRGDMTINNTSCFKALASHRELSQQDDGKEREKSGEWEGIVRGNGVTKRMKMSRQSARKLRKSLRRKLSGDNDFWQQRADQLGKERSSLAKDIEVNYGIVVEENEEVKENNDTLKNELKEQERILENLQRKSRVFGNKQKETNVQRPQQIGGLHLRLLDDSLQEFSLQDSFDVQPSYHEDDSRLNEMTMMSEFCESQEASLQATSSLKKTLATVAKLRQAITNRTFHSPIRNLKCKFNPGGVNLLAEESEKDDDDESTKENEGTGNTQTSKSSSKEKEFNFREDKGNTIIKIKDFLKSKENLFYESSPSIS